MPTKSIDNAACVAVLDVRPVVRCRRPCSGLRVGRKILAYCDAHGGLGRAAAEGMAAELRPRIPKKA